MQSRPELRDYQSLKSNEDLDRIVRENGEVEVYCYGARDRKVIESSP